MNGSDFHQNFNDFFDGLQLERRQTNRAEHLTLRSEIGEGSIHRFIPRFDIEVVFSEYKFHQNRNVNLFLGSAMVELSYCFQGAREVSLGGKRYEVVPGSCALQFMNQTADAHFDFSGNQPFQMLGIGIPVDTFHHFMEGIGGSRSIDFFQLLGRESFRIFEETIDPSSTVILKQLMHSIHTNNTRNLEMECKVLELLSLSFRSFLTDSNPESTKLTGSELQKIKKAREIMLERMTEPPSLLELSRLIGLNDYKLKAGFKEVYGTTVFGYLRDKRLEKALLLLQQGDNNVNEASCAVGYSNPSYFAEAFREKYGVNPGEFVRRSSSFHQ
jgi:AraC-like DNA-binding protein